ncbi:MAG: hypothetical protein ACLFPH_07135 [Bacteroidales bacterium]
MEDQIISHILETYGLSGAAIILLSILIYKKFNKKKVSKFLRKVFIEWLSYDGSRLVSKDLTERKIDCVINMALGNLLQKYDACRAYVFEYHNYDRRLKPIPFLYASNTYEVVTTRRNVTSEKDNLQNIPINCVDWWIKRLAEDRKVFFDDIDKIKEKDMEAYKILKDQQISSIICVSLLDFRSIPIGFVGLDYCSESDCRIAQEDTKVIELEAVKIAGLLAMKRNGTLEQLAGTL